MATTTIKSLGDIKKTLADSTTPTVSDTTTEFPTTLDTPIANMETEDNSTVTNTTNSAPSVNYVKDANTPLPGLVDYDEVITSDPVQLGSIQRIEGGVTSKTSTPMTIAGQPDKVIPTIVSVEQMAYQLKMYIENYLKKNTSLIVPFKTHPEAKICGEAFLQLVNYVVGCNHPQIYEAIYNFFKEHKNGILNEHHALQGTNYLKKEESMRTQIFYEVFNRITDVPRRALNVDIVRSIFTGEQGNTLINYLVMKTS